MNIRIFGKNLTVSSALHQVIEEKFAVLERFGEPVDARITIDRNRHHRRGDVFSVRAHLAYRGETIMQEEQGADVYACVDQLAEKLQGHLARSTDRQRQESRRQQAVLSPRSILSLGGDTLRSLTRLSHRRARRLWNFFRESKRK